MTSVAMLMTVVVAGGVPSAQHAAVRIEERKAGPYNLEIRLYDERPSVQRPLRLMVRALGGSLPLTDAVITAVGVPGPETFAVPTRPVRLHPSAELPGGYAGELLLSVRGAWDLEVHVAAPGGVGMTRVPLSVTAPYVVPGWVGWLVGLSPLIGLAWFAWWQRAYLRRLKDEEV